MEAKRSPLWGESRYHPRALILDRPQGTRLAWCYADLDNSSQRDSDGLTGEGMKQLEASIRTFNLDRVKVSLTRLGVTRLSSAN